MTTTPSSRHISDFRQQKRTDSRADKPDVFPGFDLDSPTPSPRKRRRQAYSKLIRLFLQNTRDRLETIRDVIKDESELHFRLARPLGVETDVNAASAMGQMAKIRFAGENNDDDANRQFIDLAFADATDSHESAKIVSVENESSDKVTQTYLNSLFAAIGYNRITTTPSSPIDGTETLQGNIISRYLINPLLSAWNSTRDRFNWNNANADDDRTLNDNNATDGETTIFRVNFFDNTDIKTKTHTNSSSSNTNKDPNPNRVDNFNYSLPLIQLTANNVTSVMPTNETTMQANANKVNGSQSILDNDDIGVDHNGNDKKPRNAPATAAAADTVKDAAAAAFRNAFLKYSNYMQHPMEYAKFNTTSEYAKFTQDHFDEMKSDKLLDGGFFASDLFDTNSSHIQVVPSKKLNINESLSESATSANNVDDNIESNTKTFAENAGILILEIFGTVIGATWRAVADIPNYFQATNQTTHH